MLPFRFKLLSLLCFLFLSTLHAQEAYPDAGGFGVEGNFMTGKIIRHSRKFTAPIPAFSNAFDANFSWKTYGKKEWHQRRNFPVVGFGITYPDYGNNTIFGRCLGVYPNLQFTFLKRERMEWTFRFGNGISYVTRKYQKTFPVDTLNTAIGTNINDFAIFATDIRLHLDDHWHMQFGANFTHISNTDVYQPNLGINMAGIHLGVQYFPTTCKPKPIIKELPNLKNPWLIQGRVGVAFNEARAKDSMVMPSYITSLYASRRWHNVNKMYFGIDYAYHSDVYAFLKNYGVDYGHEMGHSWDGAFFAGNEFIVGRFGIMGQIGVYYRQTFLKFDPFYEKIGTNFYILRQEHGPVKELFLSAMLLTHEIVAQYGELGVGFGL